MSFHIKKTPKKMLFLYIKNSFIP
uniref:Uncharacterized protein n=1 Tax=Anguilla anguilla TaxID=7936 RepID=A0A0E9XCT6_ANGAN